jgi:quercetin dioxygenase-like cupin family protein
MSAQPVVVPPGEGHRIGNVEFLARTADTPRFTFGIIEITAGRELEAHVHAAEDDAFYILEGTMTFLLGDDAVPAPPGTFVLVPPGVVHGFRNASRAEVRYLNLHVPGERFADYLRGLRDGRPFPFDQFEPPADGGRPVNEATIGPPSLDDDGLKVWVSDGDDEEPHVHADELDALYVLDGEAVLRAGDDELRAPAGAWIQIPAGVEHGLRFPTPTRCLRALVRSAG